MNDFLGNLASKSMGLAPVLQPRLVSRFEAWPMSGVLDAARRSPDMLLETEGAMAGIGTGPLTLPLENAATVQARPDPLHDDPHQHDNKVPLQPRTLQPFPLSEPEQAWTQQAALMPAPILSQPAPSGRGVSGETAAPARIDPAGAARDGRAALEPHVLLPAKPIVERTERVIIEHEHAAREHEAVPVAMTPTASPVAPLVPTPRMEAQPIDGRTPPQRVKVERELSERDRTDQPGVARSPAAVVPKPVAVDARSATHPIVTPIIERLERVRETPEGGEHAQPGLIQTSHPPITASRSVSESQLPGPPTIHVTIGRIEVRATPPPVPVRRTEPTANTMSLEEYLASQVGNRR